ncbi:SigE family RNA polymerase sigma factor [Actinocrispum wychmicini]|uniref:RNA polymerase sigma-70 factor (Sigma-E family) n=1 Tax=Actinocrispum wychmicini TaxID=1213861 RepID=A0A4R2JHZ2_9PSEU|nr:SigE family RNA polymerase sigma factor [Actinocrispum wychmicini]TCO56029.1 RNA polymerase sigma-70 factor (sigma-E family) [Actinocrispum wychmicini]
MTDRDTAFADYFAKRSDALRRTAYLLCGDWHRAEDLVQVTFAKLYLAWRRITRHEALDGYARQTLVRTFLSERRLGWFRKEKTGEQLTDTPVSDIGPEDRMVLLDALTRVPPGQRAVLVLRYWEDLSVEQTAALLKCSTGTVKSQAARGLQTLRDLLTTVESPVPFDRKRTAR